MTLHSGAAKGKYAAYATEVLADSTIAAHYDDVDGKIARFHAFLYRIPSRRSFALRHMTGSTSKERARARLWLARMPQGGWNFPDDRWFKHRAKAGHYYWIAEVGHFLDDPLMQLELEMMIEREIVDVDGGHPASIAATVDEWTAVPKGCTVGETTL